MNLIRFGYNPRLFFRGGAGGRQGIFSDFDADGKAEFVVPREWGETRTSGS